MKGMWSYKIYISLVFVFITGLTYSQTTFYKSYGGGYYDAGYGLTLNNDSGYIVVGQTGNYGNYGDALLFSTDSLGTVNWWKHYGGNLEDILKDVVRDSNGNYYAVGFTRSFGADGYDGWLVKFNNQGDTIFTKTFGGSDWDFFNSLDITPTGQLIIAGESYSFAQANSDAWLLSTDSLGNLLWQHNFGGSNGKDLFNHVFITPDSVVCAFGTTFKTDSINGNTYTVLTNKLGDTLNTFEIGLPNYVEKGYSADYFIGFNDTNTMLAYLTNESPSGDFKIATINAHYDGSTYLKKIYSPTYPVEDIVSVIIKNYNNESSYVIANTTLDITGLPKEKCRVILSGNSTTFLAQQIINQNFQQRPQDLLVLLPDTNIVVLVNLEGAGPGTNSVGLLKLNSKVQFSGNFQVSNKTIKKEKTLHVYPNPARHKINVYSPKGIQKVQLRASTGKLLKTITGNTLQTITLQLSGLTNGLYFLEIYTAQGRSVRKIIKLK